VLAGEKIYLKIFGLQKKLSNAQYTDCPRSNIASYYIKWATTFWTYSIPLLCWDKKNITSVERGSQPFVVESVEHAEHVLGNAGLDEGSKVEHASSVILVPLVKLVLYRVHLGVPSHSVQVQVEVLPSLSAVKLFYPGIHPPHLFCHVSLWM